jgi:hypothetical protein
MKDFQATEEASRPQKRRKSSTSKHGITYFFLLLCVIVAFMDSDSQCGTGYGSTDPIVSGPAGYGYEIPTVLWERMKKIMNNRR